MSASNEWTEWHLTPRGWESGSEMVDIGNETYKSPPADRVLTFKYCEHMSSMYSGIDKTCNETWRGSDASVIESLLATFGPAPRRL